MLDQDKMTRVEAMGVHRHFPDMVDKRIAVNREFSQRYGKGRSMDFLLEKIKPIFEKDKEKFFTMDELIYMLIKIREKSISNEVKFSYVCDSCGVLQCILLRLPNHLQAFHSFHSFFEHDIFYQNLMLYPRIWRPQLQFWLQVFPKVPVQTYPQYYRILRCPI